MKPCNVVLIRCYCHCRTFWTLNTRGIAGGGEGEVGERVSRCGVVVVGRRTHQWKHGGTVRLKLNRPVEIDYVQEEG